MCSTIRQTAKNRRTIPPRLLSQRGATLVEFAFVVPILLALLLGIFEFARIMLARNIVTNTMNRTANLAAVIPGLDEFGDDLASETKRAEAINKLMQAAAAMPMIGAPNSGALARLENYDFTQSADYKSGYALALPDGVSPQSPLEVLIPKPLPGETADQALRNRPIVLRIHATVKSILPFIKPIPFTSTIALYREPKNYASEPVGLDCAGNPVKAGVKVECPCDETDTTDPHVIDEQTGTCVCPEQLTGDGCETCVQDGYERDPNDIHKCYCPITAANCPDGFIPPDECACKTIQCSCPNGDPNCGLHQKPGTLECVCSPCPQNYKLFGDANCTCLPCPAGMVSTDGIACQCDPAVKAACLAAGDTSYWDESTCSCKTCPIEQVANSSKSGCECKPPYKLSNGHCVCDIAAQKTVCFAANKPVSSYSCACEDCDLSTHYFEVYNNNGYCYCDYDKLMAKCPAEPVNRIIDWNYCTCTNVCTTPGYVWDDEWQDCWCDKKDAQACAAQGFKYSWGSCSCTTQTCTGGNTLNLTYGECECLDPGAKQAACAASNPPLPFDWNKCECGPSCTPPQVFSTNGNTCLCPNWNTLNPYNGSCNGSYDPKTCTCTACPAGFYISQVYNDGSTKCICDRNAKKNEIQNCVAQGLPWNETLCSAQCGSACPAGKVPNSNGNCDCPSTIWSRCTLLGAAPKWDDCTCSCAAGKHYDGYYGCICDDSPEKAACAADQNKYWDNYNCKCNSCAPGWHKDETGGTCLPTCTTTCGPNEILDTYYCSCYACPEGSMPNSAGDNCVCDPATSPECAAGSINQYWSHCNCGACSTNYKPNAEQTECICDPAVKANCVGPNKYYRDASCSCVTCSLDQVLNASKTACICKDGVDVNGSTVRCHCDAHPENCTNNQYFNSNNGYCACLSCPSYKQSTAANRTTCSVCTITDANCPNMKVDATPANCKCVACPNLQTAPDHQTCGCPATAKNSCNSTQILQGGTGADGCKCVSCPTNTLANADRSACICPVDTIKYTCKPNQYVDEASCTCKDCSGTKIQDESGTSCICPACGISTTDGDHQVLQDTSCNCQTCPAGMIIWESKCADPACIEAGVICGLNGSGEYVPIKNEI